MDKTYKLTVNRRTARPRSKRLRQLGAAASGGGGSTVVQISGGAATAPGHTHDNKSSLDQMTTRSDGYLYLTQLHEVELEDGTTEWQEETDKVNAGHADTATHADEADTAHDLDDSSPVWDELARQFLSKQKADATSYLLKLLAGAEFGEFVAGLTGGKIDETGAAELLSLILRGDLKSDNFTTGALGAGYALMKKNANGDSYLEVDRMMVRKVATFVQLLIQKIRAVGGQIILSPASMSCSRVEEHDTFYRCYFENADGAKTIAQEFAAGDQARCQTFNVKEGVNENVTNTYYWRLVVAVGENYIDLSKTDCDAGSTTPQAGDDIVQLGNRTDAARQSAIVLSAYGNDAPYLKMYRGIDSYELDGREFVNFSRTDIMLIADRLRFSTGESVKDYIDGKTATAVTNVRTEFALGDSPDVAPTDGWSTDSPQWTTGKYVWQRTAVTTAKGTTYGNVACIQGAKGEQGPQGIQGLQGDKGDTGATGKGVKALEPQYYLSTSATQQTGGTWQPSCPACRRAATSGRAPR